MEQLGLQRVDLAPRSRPVPHHIDAMLSHISENDYAIQPGCAVRTVVSDIEPLVDLQAKHGMDIQFGFPRHKPHPHVRQKLDHGQLLSTMEGAVGYAVEQDIPVIS